MRSTFIVLLLLIFTNCKSQISTKLSFADSLYLSKNALSKNFIKIKYVGDQDHPMPIIYIENDEKEGLVNQNCIAERTMIFNFITYKFSLQNNSFAYLKKCVLKNLEKLFCNSNFDKYGGFEICIKTENHIDTIYTCSFQFFEELKQQLSDYGNVCFLWIIPAINELENYSKYYIKPNNSNLHKE